MSHRVISGIKCLNAEVGRTRLFHHDLMIVIDGQSGTLKKVGVFSCVSDSSDQSLPNSDSESVSLTSKSLQPSLSGMEFLSYSGPDSRRVGAKSRPCYRHQPYRRVRSRVCLQWQHAGARRKAAIQTSCFGVRLVCSTPESNAGWNTQSAFSVTFAPWVRRGSWATSDCDTVIATTRWLGFEKR